MPAALYRLKTWCHDTWDDFCADLAIASYKNILRWFLFCCSFAFLVTILCLSPYWGTGSDYCRPDNKFDISNQYYDVWRPSNPFEVTIKFGKLSFGTAKLIDVIWDVVGLHFSVLLPQFGLDVQARSTSSPNISRITGTNLVCSIGLWEGRTSGTGIHLLRCSCPVFDVSDGPSPNLLINLQAPIPSKRA
jgi:hypothetical protein